MEETKNCVFARTLTHAARRSAERSPDVYRGIEWAYCRLLIIAVCASRGAAIWDRCEILGIAGEEDGILGLGVRIVKGT